jgi:MoaD family protein
VKVSVTFYSYFKELTGTSSVEVELAAGSDMALLLKSLYEKFPKLAAFQNSTLMAIGVDYVGKSQALKDGDDVSLFPPVQGG